MRFSCAASILFALSGSSSVLQVASQQTPTEQPSACPMVQYNVTSDIETALVTGDILDFTMTDLPVATTNINIRVFLKGDLDANAEFYYLAGENVQIGKPGREPGVHEACGDFVEEGFTMEQSLFNFVARDGTFELNMRPFRENVDPEVCPGNDSDQAYIEMSYMYCGEATLTPSSSPSSEPAPVSPTPVPTLSVSPTISPTTANPSEAPTAKPSEKTTLMPSEQPSAVGDCPTILFSVITPIQSALAVGDILDFTLTDLPEATTDIDISVFLKGDLSANAEFYYLEGENVQIGKPGREEGVHTDCSPEFVKEEFMMDQSLFNFVAQDGTFDLQMRPFRTNVNPVFCSGDDSDQAYLEMSYMYCKPPTSNPSSEPSSLATSSPIPAPSAQPTSGPTSSQKPSPVPSKQPSPAPSSQMPSTKPSAKPSPLASSIPTEQPSSCPMALYNVTTDTETVEQTEDILDFVLTGLPLAATDIDISVFLKGDLDENAEFYYLEGENILIGKPGREEGVHQDCGPFVREEFVMPVEQFNIVADDGTFDLQMRPFRNNIDVTTCNATDSNQAYIQLSYMYCVPASSTPTSKPSSVPTSTPTRAPSSEPSSQPSPNPSLSLAPQPLPTSAPSETPSSSTTSSVPTPTPSRSSTPTLTPPTSDPSSKPTTSPSLEPTESSTMPSCPITSVDIDSEQMGKSIVPCGTDKPSFETCEEISFDLDVLGDVIGNATITYNYKADNKGFWDLKAGTKSFSDASGDPSCNGQSTAVIVSAEEFNDDSPDFYMVKDGVLNVRMVYIFGGLNTCAAPQSVATINLKYDFFDCGRTSTPTASSNPTPLASAEPSPSPTTALKPSSMPSTKPSSEPSVSASSAPTNSSEAPSAAPTLPSSEPSVSASSAPTVTPTGTPSSKPTALSQPPSALASDAPTAAPSSKPSTSSQPPSALASDAPTAAPSSKPSTSLEPTVSSMMPSCPISSVDANSTYMGLMTVPCPTGFPATDTCQGIEFSFNDTKASVGDAIITYSYKGDDSGFYALGAGTYEFTDETGVPACTEQSTAVVLTAEDFNADGLSYAVQDGVLTVSMFYTADGNNTCADPKNMAKINLKYDFFDCVDM
jgi:hypothetical protein